MTTAPRLHAPHSPTDPLPSLTLSCSTGGAEIIAPLATQWRALTREGRWHQPFFQPEWFEATTRAFLPDETLVLLQAWRGHLLRGVLPLYLRDERRYGLAVRVLRGVSTVHSCRFDLIAGTDDVPEVIEALWRGVQEIPAWDLLEAEDVPGGSGLHELAALARDRGTPCRWIPGISSPISDLRLDDESASGGFARDIRRRLTTKRSRLEQQGAVHLRGSDGFDPGWFDQFCALEGAGWKGTAGTAIRCDPCTRQFYEEMSRAAAVHGYLACHSLLCGEEPVAMHLGLAMNGVYYVPKTTYDEALGKLSPGQLLVQSELARCRAAGMTTYEFLGPEADWKRVWTRSVLPHYTCRLYAPTLRGRTLAAIDQQIRPQLSRLKRLLRLEWTGGGRGGQTRGGMRFDGNGG